CFLPAILLWWVARRLSSLRPVMLRYLFAPFAVFLAIVLAYLAVSKVGEDDPRYDVSRLAETAKITAYDIRYGWGARTGEGSGYTLGELDGTWQSMIRLAPAAVNVALFRPYVWEVRSPLMALSAAESLALLGLTLLMLWKVRGNLFRYCTQP